VGRRARASSYRGLALLVVAMAVSMPDSFLRVFLTAVVVLGCDDSGGAGEIRRRDNLVREVIKD
jgi:hypothetical protein